MRPETAAGSAGHAHEQKPTLGFFAHIFAAQP